MSRTKKSGLPLNALFSLFLFLGSVAVALRYKTRLSAAERTCDLGASNPTVVKAFSRRDVTELGTKKSGPAMFEIQTKLACLMELRRPPLSPANLIQTMQQARRRAVRWLWVTGITARDDQDLATVKSEMPRARNERFRPVVTKRVNSGRRLWLLRHVTDRNLPYRRSRSHKHFGSQNAIPRRRSNSTLTLRVSISINRSAATAPGRDKSGSNPSPNLSNCILFHGKR